MFSYRAAAIRPVDGDTVVLLIDQGFDTRHETEVRLIGVYAPERTQPGGAETTRLVADWLVEAQQRNPQRRWPLTVTTVQTKTVEPGERMTFTRYLATVRAADQPDSSLNDVVNAELARHPEWGPGNV